MPSRHVYWMYSCMAAAVALVAGSASAQLAVGTWNIAQLRGDFSSIEHVLSEASTDDKPGFEVPIAVWVFQEVDTDNVDDLHDLLGPQYSQGTYTSSSEDTYSGAQAMFFHSSIVTEITSGHDDIYTGAGRRSDRWQLRLVGSSPACDFYIYSSHFKASTGSANQADRLFGVEQILENAEELPAGSCVIYAGDYNIYSSGEPAYEALVADGPSMAIDPFGNGSWSGAGNALKHTQSPRASTGGGLIGGSLDDRFDFLLFNQEFQDGAGLDYMSGTLRSFGNDGNHYDDAINDGTNTYFPGNNSRSNQLADALHDASDHIPVIANYTLPAVLSASVVSTFGPVIVGGSADVVLTIGNDVDVVTPAGGADLNWFATGSGSLSSIDESGSISAGSADQFVAIPVDTSSAGGVSGQLTIDSVDAGTQLVPSTLSVSGTVLRHSNASFSSANDENFRVFFSQFEADSGVQQIDIELFNYGFDSSQATMDFLGIEAPAAPFGFIGTPIDGIGSESIVMPITFDTTGLEAGTIIENLAVYVEDQDLPGGTADSIVLVLSVEVIDTPSCVGDYSGDGRTDVQDLLFVIKNWGAALDITDLLLVISDWDCS